MLYFVYLLKNLTRNRLRSALTAAAVALPIVIYVLSMAVVDGVDRYLDNSSKQLRLAVVHKTSIINPLPIGHRAKIESLDPTHKHIVSVCSLNWIGGKIANDPRPLSTLGVDPDTFAATFPEMNLTKEELDAWHRDRQAVVVGSATAGQFGWKLGDRITVLPSLPPFVPIELHIISLAPHATDPVSVWCRRDYLVECYKEAGMPQDQAGFFFVKCGSAEDVNKYRQAIDELFAHTPDETKTQDEKAFMSEFITQQFNLPRNLKILSAVTVFVAIMAAANTMSMTFRDRINEIAILKSMGFAGWLVFIQIQAESLLLCLVGGVVGAFGPYVAFTFTPLKDYTVPVIQVLEIHLNVCFNAVLISVGVGLIAAIGPSLLAWRMKVVNALRNVE